MNIRICKGKSCSSRGAEFIERRLMNDTAFYHYPPEVTIESCGCQNRCKEGPTVIFGEQTEVHMNPVKASETLRRRIEEAKQRVGSSHQ